MPEALIHNHTFCYISPAGIIKVCLALEYGMMPANLHYHRDTPNPDSAGLRDGTLEVSFLKPSFCPVCTFMP